VRTAQANLGRHYAHALSTVFPERCSVIDTLKWNFLTPGSIHLIGSHEYGLHALCNIQQPNSLNWYPRANSKILWQREWQTDNANCISLHLWRGITTDLRVNGDNTRSWCSFTIINEQKKKIFWFTSLKFSFIFHDF